jgi:carboxypeptidase family protein
MRNWLIAALSAVLVSMPATAAPGSPEKGYGRLAGTVLDTEGNPLMGATILVMGPMAPGVNAGEASVERLVTDFRGEFAVGHLLPGWYSLRASATTRIPALRTDIRVEPGRTAREKFVLGDIFSSLRIQSPKTTSSSWGEDWKWILRTSASTRPILRFQDDPSASATNNGEQPLPASQRVFGVTPGTSRGQALNSDPGQGSVLAYFLPLSGDSDVLVAGSMAADGSAESTLATAFRRNLMKGDPLELALAVHQLSFSDGIPLAGGDIQESLRRARVFVATYNNSRRLSDSLTLTTGMEVDYLNAGVSASSARPHASLAYRLSGSDLVEVKYGAFNPAAPDDLVERIGVLTAYPQITMSSYHPEFEQLNHAEANITHRFDKRSSLQVAAYRDSFHNMVVWGFGGPAAMGWLAADALPNPAAEGWTLNAGNYTSSGLRVAYIRHFGNLMDAAFTYASGEALESGATVSSEHGASLRDNLRPTPSQSFGGKLSARIPRSKTQVTTSYEWIGRNRVTGIDPFGEAELRIEPFLNIQVRQPLPPVAFIPGRIEAMAEFGNPFQQGYVAASRSGDQMILTPVYRSFRGGFSVQF